MDDGARPAELATLDPGIARYVHVLYDAGVETFESCEGGPGHAMPEPTIRFHGRKPDGLKALAVALENDLPVYELRRTWSVIDGEITGPYWALVFYLPSASRRAQCSHSGRPPVPSAR